MTSLSRIPYNIHFESGPKPVLNQIRDNTQNNKLIIVIDTSKYNTFNGPPHIHSCLLE